MSSEQSLQCRELCKLEKGRWLTWTLAHDFSTPCRSPGTPLPFGGTPTPGCSPWEHFLTGLFHTHHPPQGLHWGPHGFRTLQNFTWSLEFEVIPVWGEEATKKTSSGTWLELMKTVSLFDSITPSRPSSSYSFRRACSPLPTATSPPRSPTASTLTPHVYLTSNKLLHVQNRNCCVSCFCGYALLFSVRLSSLEAKIIFRIFACCLFLHQVPRVFNIIAPRIVLILISGNTSHNILHIHDDQ